MSTKSVPRLENDCNPGFDTDNHWDNFVLNQNGTIGKPNGITETNYTEITILFYFLTVCGVIIWLNINKYT